MFVFLLILVLSCTTSFAQEEAIHNRTLWVSVAVADLRKEPIPAKENSFDHDPLQETQLLYGEKVVVLEQKGNWSRVRAIEQLEWTHHEKWEGYPGWVRTEQLASLSDTEWQPNAVVTVPLAPVHENAI